MTLAFVCGCAGLDLTADELAFLARTDPWGLILFRRNVDSPDQLRSLTARFREAVGRPQAPVLVDQEGGRVRRLRPPHWPDHPAAALCGRLDGPRGIEAARLGARLIAHDLHAAGITVDCAPVLDVAAPGAHDVIGDRAFGRDPDVVARLGRAFAEGLLAGGVLPVMKHMPGHGRAGVDSHLDLPVVEADRAALEARDFAPFRALNDLPAGMTAHVRFTAIDPERPATTSKAVIGDVIRGTIGFQGLLFTDDLSMEALRGSLGERAADARDAGCDILLHCNGKLDEAEAVAAAARPFGGLAEARANAALGRVGPPQPFDAGQARARLAELLDGVPTA